MTSTTSVIQTNFHIQWLEFSCYLRIIWSVSRYRRHWENVIPFAVHVRFICDYYIYKNDDGIGKMNILLEEDILVLCDWNVWNGMIDIRKISCFSMLPVATGACYSDIVLYFTYFLFIFLWTEWFGKEDFRWKTNLQYWPQEKFIFSFFFS